MADRPRAAVEDGAARAHGRSVAGPIRRNWRPSRTRPRCWRSATRSAPASTSSATANKGAKAIPTASPPRLRASTRKIPAPRINRSGQPIPVPRVTGKISRKYPVSLRDLQFLRANTDRPVKMTVPGPFTMSKQAQNEFYASDEAMALDYAAAVNEEIKDLFAAGADIVQIDEPWMQQHPDKARAYGLNGARPRARRRHRHGRRASVLRLCRGRARASRRATRSCPSWKARRPRRVSIEAAQPKLDLKVLEKLPSQDHHPRRHRSCPT